MSRRVVVLTTGGDLAARLLPLLAERGVRPTAVMVYVPSALAEWRGLRTLPARLLHLPLLPLRWARRRLRPRRDPRLRPGGAPLVVTGPLNGPRMLRDLRRLRPDVVVLAGCGIVSPEVLAVPPGGVAGVHPGLLPWTRGSSPSLHSLARGVPLGATAFRVDAGIDTGPIVARRLLPVAGGETLAELRAALRGLWVEMTADLVAAAAAGRLGPGSPQGARFPLCPRLEGPAGLEPAAAAVARGRAKALFDRWRPFCDPRDLSLPPPADDALLPGAVAGKELGQSAPPPIVPETLTGPSL